MNHDLIYGPRLYDELLEEDINLLMKSVVRSPIQYFTLQGYISENRVIRHLTELRGVSTVRRIPDNADGHGGDVSFRFNGKTYTMEIKTLTLKDGKGKVHIRPTRKSDIIGAYRIDSFDLLAICISSRLENGLLFARAVDLPKHKVDGRFIQASMTLKEQSEFAPFTYTLSSLLK